MEKRNKLVQITNDEYHSEEEHYSSSRMKKALSSLADFNNYVPLGDKPEFAVGHAFETMLCTPADFIVDVAIFNPNDRPDASKTFAAKINKEWKADFYEEEDRLIITSDDMKILTGMVKASLSNELIEKFIGGGIFQKSVFWVDENGLPVKTRPDIILHLGGGKLVNIDVKSIYKQSEFPYQMRKLNYPFQMVMQVKGLEAAGYEVVNCFWLVVDKVENPTAVLYTFTNQQIEEMRGIYDTTSKRIVEAIKTGYFPTYAEENGNEIGAVELDLESYFDYLKNN